MFSSHTSLIIPALVSGFGVLTVLLHPLLFVLVKLCTFNFKLLWAMLFELFILLSCLQSNVADNKGL